MKNPMIESRLKMKRVTKAVLALVMVMAVGTPAFAKAHKKKPKGEEVKWKEVPAVVQTALHDHAAGGKITRVAKDKKKETLIYTAEVKATDGAMTRVVVTDSGKLVGVKAEKQRPKPKHFGFF